MPSAMLHGGSGGSMIVCPLVSGRTSPTWSPAPGIGRRWRLSPFRWRSATEVTRLWQPAGARAIRLAQEQPDSLASGYLLSVEADAAFHAGSLDECIAKAKA
jgi:hypothetical protein